MLMRAHFCPVSDRKDRRDDVRQRILLIANGSLAEEIERVVLIRDISAEGMLIETATKLQIGEQLEIELPDCGPVDAKVVWVGDRLAGCRFAATLSQATLSAAQLKSAATEFDPLDTAVSGKSAQDLAARLQALRIQRNLSRAELAERANISIPSIWAWETGRTSPRKRSLYSLAKGLGVPLEILEQSTPKRALEGSDWDQDTVSSLAALIEASKDRIANYARTDPAKVRITIEF